MDILDNNLDAILDANLESYTTPSSQSLFSTHREISIARYALSQQAEAYHKAVSLLQTLLDSQQDQLTSVLSTQRNPQETARLLSNIFQQVQSIELKSQKLIESSQRVTQLLGQAVAIDVDKASLHSLVLNLPHILRDVLLEVSGDELLTSKICNKLTQQLESTLSQLRFTPQAMQPSQLGITQESIRDQYTEMLNSVPSQPN